VKQGFSGPGFPSCSETVLERSAHRLVESGVEIKAWLHRTPTVAEVRPACCPACGAASSPVGGQIALHGHGLRERVLLGPPEAHLPPEERVARARRYRCTACRAVILVVPRGVLRRRLFTAAAIALGLCLWAVYGQAAREVRAALSPRRHVGVVAGWSWTTLGRWARAASAGELLGVRPQEATDTTRARAARAVHAVAARAAIAMRDAPVCARVFAGAAAHAA
jgi:hypothetical protein